MNYREVKNTGNLGFFNFKVAFDSSFIMFFIKITTIKKRSKERFFYIFKNEITYINKLSIFSFSS